MINESFIFLQDNLIVPLLDPIIGDNLGDTPGESEA